MAPQTLLAPAARRTTPLLTRTAAPLAVAVAILAAGCGGDEGSGTDGAGTGASNSAAQAHGEGHGTAAGDAERSHNDADVMFAQMMVPHHQQAIELTDLVPGRTSNPDVIALSSEIAAAQGPEITQMTTWLQQWGAPTGGDHTAHGGMAGMVDAPTMARLGTLDGAAFDRLWLESMLAHHRGAVDMARDEVADGKEPAVVALAQQIIDTQQREIDRITTLLGQ